MWITIEKIGGGRIKKENGYIFKVSDKKIYNRFLIYIV